MKYFTALRNRIRSSSIKNNRGQGATEYILLLVVVVGMIVAFGPKIKSMIAAKTASLDTDMQSVNKDM